MISVEEIRRQAKRAYPRYLSGMVTGEAFFPLDVRFGKRFMTGSYHAFAEAREHLLQSAVQVLEGSGGDGSNDVSDSEIAAVDAAGRSNGSARSKSGYVVELQEHNSRRFGVQAVPSRIYFDDADAYASFIGHRDQIRAFGGMVEETRRRVPGLIAWLSRNALRAVTYADEWDDLLEIAQYFLEHARPNVFPRQLPLSVHTKFVEEHEGILRLMLDELLPEEAVDRRTNDFAPRFGLRFDEPLVRIRRLDPAVEQSWPTNDVSMPLSAVADLDPAVETVVISENKMTFLTLPFVARGLGLWGVGFRVELFRRIDWLRRCAVYYWGDLDAHGFMILSQLRSFLPDARSLMMDVPTFEAFRSFAVEGPSSEVEGLPNLTPAEEALYQSLARTRLRLEQERIPQPFVVQQLSAIP